MTVMSKVVLDARAGTQAVTDLPAGAELQLKFATQISADDARAWAAQKPKDGHLTALVDLPEAARLNVQAWLNALQPDVVELRLPAWSEAGMTAIGWPAGLAVLQKTLAALAAAQQVTTRLSLHVSSLTLPELTADALNVLATEAGLDALTVVLRPVLGDHAPALNTLAQATVALWQSNHAVTASRLLPACAIPEGVDGDATFASERAAARQSFTAECARCPARDTGRCDGMAADLLRATTAAGITWTGWETLETDREPVIIVAEPNETLEEMALRLGLRRVWRSELPAAEAEVLGAHPPPGLVVLAGAHVTLDPEATLQVGLPDANAQILYLARELADAEAARVADEAASNPDPDVVTAAHRELGALLGYPDCCVTAFLEARTERQAAGVNSPAEHAYAVVRAGRASARLDRRLNFGSPIDDACLVRHVPCAFDCAASLAHVQELELELARIAPGRLETKLALRVDAALVFADSAHVPFRGALTPEGGLQSPVVVNEWDSNTPRGRLAQRAWEAIASQVGNADSLTPTHAFAGPGGVTVKRADGTEEALTIGDLSSHPDFPRLVVFSAD